MTTTEALNGVNLEAFAQIGEAGRVDRAATRFTFSMAGQWAGGTRMLGTSGAAVMAGSPDPERKGRFELVSDEPAPLGGDSGPSPTEYVLHALAGCYTVTLAALAAQRQMTLEACSITVEGDVDLAGFVGVDPETRPGVSQVRVAVEVVAPQASREEIEQLVADVERNSSIRDTLANPVEVITTLS